MEQDEERIRELIQKIAAANGTHEVVDLAKELRDLLEARKKRLAGNPLAD